MKIWKLQKPLNYTNDGEYPQIMAYTENKERMAMIPCGMEVIDTIFGDEVKIYVKATVKNGVLKVRRRVPEQDW